MEVTQEDFDGVIKWTKDYFAKTGLTKAVIGLSGGIDSAVVASLCVRALGRDNVIGVEMPCESQLIDSDLAWSLGENLKLHSSCGDLGGVTTDQYLTFNLDETFHKFWTDYKENMKYNDDIFPRTYNKLVPANIKARLRMTILYAIAGHVGGLVVGTTNKTEGLLGYATKYGDGGVDIEPIQDFYKTQVYGLAKMLGDIPQEIMDRAPTAGLWDGQTDEDELGATYREIDTYLEASDKNWALSWDTKLIEKIENAITVNAHKNMGLPYYVRGGY